MEEGTDAIEVLDKVFPGIEPAKKEIHRDILNRPGVRKLIRSVSKADEIFMSLVEVKDIKKLLAVVLLMKLFTAFVIKKLNL